LLAAYGWRTEMQTAVKQSRNSFVQPKICLLAASGAAGVPMRVSFPPGPLLLFIDAHSSAGCRCRCPADVGSSVWIILGIDSCGNKDSEYVLCATSSLVQSCTCRIDSKNRKP
jgi:hypothetical protein